MALVTGANTGIGLAIARRLQADGFAIGFATRDRSSKSREAFEEVASLGPAAWVTGDLGDPDVPRKLVQQTVAELGRLDALVSNAGLTRAKPVLELDADDFDDLFAVDVRAALLLAQAASGVFDEGGVIVNVTSVHEHAPRPGFALYAAAKAALGMLTRGLALELAPRGVRVVAVAPGLVATERNEEAKELGQRVPLGRAAEPAEVASLVSYAVSDDASYVTGASLRVDGGLLEQPFHEPAD